MSDLQIVLGCSLVAIISWSVWLFRTSSSGYTPFEQNIDEKVSVIIPVYNEDPHLFKACVDSIVANNPDEIIIANDEFSNNSMEFLDSFGYENIVLITSKHGKRRAMADGCKAAKHNIIVYSDSDSIWRHNTKEELLRGFYSGDIAGVGTRQLVLNANKSIARRIANFMLNTKYLYFQQALSVKGIVSCLSGRTVAYRKQAVLDVLDEFEHETFLGAECVSGDDVSLTCLVLRNGYKTVYQSTSVIESEFPDSILKLCKMRIRWGRNSYRAYLKALADGWVFKRHPLLGLTMIYVMISPLIIFSLLYTTMHSPFIIGCALLFVAGRFVRG